MWFVSSVNWLHNLPYLQVIEVVLLGAPIAYHGVLGIRYLMTSKSNVIGGGGKSPKLSYGRNWAYTLQRITSWILLIGLVLHVWYMRFYIYPTVVRDGGQTYYFANYYIDDGLYPVADRLQVKLYDFEAIEREKNNFAKQATKMDLLRQKLETLQEEEMQDKGAYNAEVDSLYQSWQLYKGKEKFLQGLESKTYKEGEVVAVTTNFGNIMLLNVREAFKSITKCILYTIFVLAACFHAFNGLWTFLITWGLILNLRAQSRMVSVCYALMLLVSFLGLMSIWGTYWINLRN
jgi:succinate dehydrogenase / fumarate reductase cytochrome b subunit